VIFKLQPTFHSIFTPSLSTLRIIPVVQPLCTNQSQNTLPNLQMTRASWHLDGTANDTSQTVNDIFITYNALLLEYIRKVTYKHILHRIMIIT
jgi:hypothetical protein